MAATMALAMSGPMPGTVINWRQLSLPCARTISSVTCWIRSSRRRQSPLRSSMILIIRGDNTSLRLARMSGSCWRRKRSPLTYRNAVLQQRAAVAVQVAWISRGFEGVVG